MCHSHVVSIHRRYKAQRQATRQRRYRPTEVSTYVPPPVWPAIAPGHNSGSHTYADYGALARLPHPTGRPPSCLRTRIPSSAEMPIALTHARGSFAASGGRAAADRKAYWVVFVLYADHRPAPLPPKKRECTNPSDPKIQHIYLYVQRFDESHSTALYYMNAHRLRKSTLTNNNVTITILV